MKCQLSKFAAAFSEATGSDCFRDAVAPYPFCEECLHKLVAKAQRNVPPSTDSRATDYVKTFLTAFVSTLGAGAGAAVLKVNWETVEQIAKTLMSVVVGYRIDSGGELRSIDKRFLEFTIPGEPGQLPLRQRVSLDDSDPTPAIERAATLAAQGLLDRQASP